MAGVPCNCYLTRQALLLLGQSEICPRCLGFVEQPPFDDTYLSYDSSDAESLSSFEGPVNMDRDNDDVRRDANIPFKIRPYSGSADESLDATLAKFDRFCDLNGRDADYKASNISFLLSGKPFKLYETFPEATKLNYDLVCERLRNSYSDLQLPSEIIIPKLTNLKMGPTDTVQSFYEKIVTTGARADVPQDVLRALFVNGLEKEIRQFVFLRAPQDMQEAHLLAKQAEHLRTDKSTDLLNAATPQSAAVSLGSSSLFDKLESKLESLEHKLNSLTDHNINASRTMSNHDICDICRSPAHATEDCRQRTSSRLCGICKSPNHSSDNCRELLNVFKKFESLANRMPNNDTNRFSQRGNFHTGNLRRGSFNGSYNDQRSFHRQNPTHTTYGNTNNNSSFRNNNYQRDGRFNSNDFNSNRRVHFAPQNQTSSPARQSGMDSRLSSRGDHSSRFGSRGGHANNFNSSHSWHGANATDIEEFTPSEDDFTSMGCSTSWFNNNMIVPFTFMDKTGTLLIDSGSSINILNLDFLNSAAADIELQPSRLTTISTVSGSKTPVFGQLTFEVSLGDRTFCVTFQVLKAAQDGILGRDFLNDHGAIIDFNDSSLTFSIPGDSNKLQIKMGSNISPATYLQIKRAPMLLSSSVVIPELTEQLVEFRLDGMVSETPFLCEGSSNIFDQHGILVASAVTRPTRGLFPCRIINTFPHPVRLRAGTQLGVAVSIPDSVEVFSATIPPDETMDFDAPPHKVDFNIDDNLTDSQRSELLALLELNAHVFAASDAEMGKTTTVEHKIDVDNAPPKKSAPYRVNTETREKIRAHVTQLLELDIIEPSYSPWSSPVILVKKSDGSSRFVLDFRFLNSVTVKDAYPLPRCDDVLESLGGSRYFSSLDLRQGFFQVPLEENSRQYTAFATSDGLFQFKRMAQGLTNSPATFQRLMDQVLRHLNFRTSLVYLDDVIVYARTFAEHLTRLQEVFTRLNEHGLTLKTQKCFFAKTELKFLGHVLSGDGIRPTPDKVKIVQD